MQAEQSTWPLVRENEQLTTMRKNRYQNASCIVISAPASQFHVGHQDTLKDIRPNERLCFVLAQTPDVTKFTFEQVNGRMLLNTLLPFTTGYDRTMGKIFFELVFDLNTRGVILFNRSRHQQRIEPFTFGSSIIIESGEFSEILPPGYYRLKTKNFNLLLKILSDDECNDVSEAVQAGNKRKRYTVNDDQESSSQALVEGSSKHRKVGLPDYVMS